MTILHILETRTAKLVIRFEVRSFFFSRGYFLKCAHLTIPPKLHCPKGDWINESLPYQSTPGRPDKSLGQVRTLQHALAVKMLRLNAG